MKTAILNANLAPGGKSAHLAELVAGRFNSAGHEASVHHAGDLQLPACDGSTCYQDPKTIDLTSALGDVDGIVLIAPIYNYDLNAAAKNLIELTGGSWKGKAVGLICQAGGEKSYLAPLGFFNSLSVDYRCLVSPRYVYVTRDQFGEDNTLSDESPVHGRIDTLVAELPILADAAEKIAALPKS